MKGYKDEMAKINYHDSRMIDIISWLISQLRGWQALSPFDTYFVNIIRCAMRTEWWQHDGWRLIRHQKWGYQGPLWLDSITGPLWLDSITSISYKREVSPTLGESVCYNILWDRHIRLWIKHFGKTCSYLRPSGFSNITRLPEAALTRFISVRIPKLRYSVFRYFTRFGRPLVSTLLQIGRTFGERSYENTGTFRTCIFLAGMLC